MLTAAVSLSLAAAPLLAQEDQPFQIRPMNDQEQTPGLQQTPEGQVLKTAGDKTSVLEIYGGAAATAGSSTGPFVPNSPPSK